MFSFKSAIFVALLASASHVEAGVKGQVSSRAVETEERRLNNGKGKGSGGTTTTDPNLSGTPFEHTMNLYEWAAAGLDPPACGSVGQNESFQGAALIGNQGGEQVCKRVNICHGNAGFGWNRITVDRDAVGVDNNGQGGHAKLEHNNRTNKRPDFYPGTISVPNPNGAGINGYLDGACNFHCAEDDTDCVDVEAGEGDDSPPTDAPTDAPGPGPAPAPTPNVSTRSSASGDPHFKTFNGDKYDYHGECDLVLIDNPEFDNGKGLRLHIRTTRIKYFSFIEKVALQIGEEVLEFANDVHNFLLNGEPVPPNVKHHKTMLDRFPLRRGTNAVSVMLFDAGYGKHNKTKIDFYYRKNGFPAVVVDPGHLDIFKGSRGLLGEWPTGNKVDRNGNIMEVGEDATAFALEWQVRDTEPMLFKEARYPQFPTQCTPPAKMPTRLGSQAFRVEAEEACGHWRDEDKEDCIFDVMATRDIMVAEEGSIMHVM